jgi:hypothetical protein
MNTLEMITTLEKVKGLSVSSLVTLAIPSKYYF